MSGISQLLASNLVAQQTAPPSQVAYTTPGTYSWVCPAGVTSVCVVCVGGGASGGYTFGGQGGGLGWKNNITVTPGTSYTVVVGAGNNSVTSGSSFPGGNSYFSTSATVAGQGGGNGRSYVGDGGGNGGSSGNYAGGAGAGGYSGAGGNAPPFFDSDTPTGGSGSGGAGGAGSGGSGYTDFSTYDESYVGGSGGGVGLLGQGSSGAGGIGASNSQGYPGGGGSGGETPARPATINSNGTRGGSYGAGGGCGYYYFNVGGGTFGLPSGPGANGAVRIIWGTGRSFPSTNTGNV